MLDTVQKYPMRAFISESFRIPGNTASGYTWDSPKDEATIADYRSKGYESRNFVQSLMKVE